MSRAGSWGDAELQECDKTLLAGEGQGPPWEQGDVVTAHTVIGPSINTAKSPARATAAASARCLIPYLYPPCLCHSNILSLIYYKYFNTDNNNEKYLA